MRVNNVASRDKVVDFDKSSLGLWGTQSILSVAVTQAAGSLDANGSSLAQQASP